MRPASQADNIQQTAPAADQALRLDVWLWRARFYKSRSLCTRTVRKGRIRLNRGGQILRISKPNTIIRPGDKLTFMRGEELFHIEIQSLGLRRGPAPEARALYVNLQPGPSQNPICRSLTG